MKQLLMILLALVLTSWLLADGVQPEGSGTSSDPYQVESLDNLLWLSTTPDVWDSCFIQTADIDASETENWNDGEGFSPIGIEDYPFTGSYNGNSHIISGLVIFRPCTIRQALFGYTHHAVFSKITLVDVSVNGYNSNGGVCGYMEGGAITECFTTGFVMSSNYSVGGVAGYMRESTQMRDCSSSANVIGKAYVGGLVGYAKIGSHIENCYSHGGVAGDERVGGLVGDLEDSSVDKCYSTGAVLANEMYGGLIGNNATSNCSNSFWNIETSGCAFSQGGTGKTAAEMRSVATYTHLITEGLTEPWDFVGDPFDDEGEEDLWDIDAELNGGYPYFGDMVMGLEDDPGCPSATSVINLTSVYPNPFNPSTTIAFSIAHGNTAELLVFNNKGQRVRSLGQFNAGDHTAIWDGLDDHGQAVASGVYFSCLRSAHEQQTSKMLLLK